MYSVYPNWLSQSLKMYSRYKVKVLVLEDYTILECYKSLKKKNILIGWVLMFVILYCYAFNLQNGN